jgi:hypothetical protein
MATSTVKGGRITDVLRGAIAGRLVPMPNPLWSGVRGPIRAIKTGAPTSASRRSRRIPKRTQLWLGCYPRRRDCPYDPIALVAQRTPAEETRRSVAIRLQSRRGRSVRRVEAKCLPLGIRYGSSSSRPEPIRIPPLDA